MALRVSQFPPSSPLLGLWTSGKPERRQFELFCQGPSHQPGFHQNLRGKDWATSAIQPVRSRPSEGHTYTYTHTHPTLRVLQPYRRTVLLKIVWWMHLFIVYHSVAWLSVHSHISVPVLRASWLQQGWGKWGKWGKWGWCTEASCKHQLLWRCCCSFALFGLQRSCCSNCMPAGLLA